MAKKKKIEEGNYLRELRDVAIAIKQANAAGVKVNFLIGAGCSVTGGIPLANELIEDVKKNFSNEFNYCKSRKYGDIMAMITATERRQLIQGYVKEAKINWAHLMIAHLLNKEIINCVITTNFDNLLLRASAMVDNFPAIYDLAASKEFQNELEFKNAIIHLHGQHTGGLLCNTSGEVKEQKERIQKIFFELNKNCMWVVLGYSGEADPIAEIFMENKNSYNRLYWIGYKDSKINKKIEDLFKEQERYCYYVKKYDADNFMVELVKHLDECQPTIVESPFRHLSNIINNLTDFKKEKMLPVNPQKSNLEIMNNFVEAGIAKVEEDFKLVTEYYLDLGLFDGFDSYKQNLNTEDQERIHKILNDYQKENEKEREKNIENWIENLDLSKIEEIIPDIKLGFMSIEIFFNEKCSYRLSEILYQKIAGINTLNISKLKIDILFYLYKLSTEDSKQSQIINTIEKEVERVKGSLNKQQLGMLSIKISRCKINLYEKKDFVKANDECKKALDSLEKIKTDIDIVEYTYTSLDIYIDKIILEVKVNNEDIIEEIFKIGSLMNIYLSFKEKESSKYWFDLSNIFRKLLNLNVELNTSSERYKVFVKKIKNLTILNKEIFEDERILLALISGFEELEKSKLYNLNDELNELCEELSKVTGKVENEEIREDLAVALNTIAYNFILQKEDYELLKKIIDISINLKNIYYNEITKLLYELHISEEVHNFKKKIEELIEKLDKDNNKTLVPKDEFKELIKQNTCYQVGKFYQMKGEYKRAYDEYKCGLEYKENSGNNEIIDKINSKIVEIEEEEEFKILSK